MEIVADDWGFSKGINEGILDLSRRKIVRTVSLIANAPELDYRLKELLEIPGLRFAFHMNFTAGTPLLGQKVSSLVSSRTNRFYSLKGFLWRWLASRIEPRHAEAEAQAQLSTLLERLPGVFEADGHENVHLIPGVLESLLPVYERFAVRSVRLPLSRTHLPSFVGSSLVLLRRKKFGGLNLRLFGYPRPSDFGDRRDFLSAARDGARPVLVHPAAYDDFTGNPYGDTLCAERVRQYQWLRDSFT